MKTEDNQLSRRKFLQTLTVATTSVALLSPWRSVFASTADRSLSFFHTHTGEHLKLTYFSDGQYQNAALQEINYCLRDFRTGEAYPIEPQLMDLLAMIQTVCDSHGTYEIISGYRSPKTNESLRNEGRGVAKRSLHMLGQAIDVRLTDIETSHLRKAAASLKQGGVGYYAKSDFVHIDTGRVRFW